MRDTKKGSIQSEELINMVVEVEIVFGRKEEAFLEDCINFSSFLRSQFQGLGGVDIKTCL